MTHYSTKAKRKALAAMVAEVASDVLGVKVEMTESTLHPGEYDWGLKSYESERGKVAWLHLDVCPRGVNVHSKFSAPQFAPIGANKYSGKWNHYLWTDCTRSIAHSLAVILEQLRPTGDVRHDRPDMSDYWAAQ